MYLSRHLKVLHIASGDLWAGAETQLYTLSKTLHMSGISVAVILFNDGTLRHRLDESGIRVYLLDESILNTFTIFKQLVSIIRKEKPDVVHTHRRKENILGSIAALIAGNVPSLRTVHGAPEYHATWLHLYKHMAYRIDELCGRYLQRKIISVSDELSDKLSIIFPEEKIQVIENGVDLSSIDQYQYQSKLLHRRKGQTIRVAFIGRLVPVKRADIFIKTACYLRDNYPELKTSFHIYGDGPLRIHLENLTRMLNISDHVHFEGHCDDILERSHEIDLLLITSDHEGLPMVLLESMAIGIPVIAHAVGGIPKTTLNNTCAILVSTQAPSDYAHKIYQFSTMDDSQKIKMTENAKKRISENYTNLINSKAYIKQYEEITSRYRTYIA